HQLCQVAIVFLGKVRFRHDGELGVADPQGESAIERVILAAIEQHARGDVEALERGIIEELRAAGLEIRRMDAIPIRNPRRRSGSDLKRTGPDGNDSRTVATEIAIELGSSS